MPDQPDDGITAEVADSLVPGLRLAGTADQFMDDTDALCDLRFPRAVIAAGPRGG